MRISDWSSDVCSSDLPGDARDFVADLKQRIVGDEERVIALRWRQKMHHHQRVRRDLLCGDAKPLHRLGQSRQCARHPVDRKSVVEGKSVSVRVDLGGRRNIKKKIKEKIDISK